VKKRLVITFDTDTGETRITPDQFISNIELYGIAHLIEKYGEHASKIVWDTSSPLYHPVYDIPPLPAPKKSAVIQLPASKKAAKKKPVKKAKHESKY